MTVPLRTATTLLPWAVSLGFIALWLGLAALRIGYPFELEWMEGGMLDHIERVRAGTPLYAAPSLEFGSYPYTPLFPWAAAASAEVFGAGFASARGVSVLATLVTLALLWLHGARANRSTGGTALAGALAAGFLAAGYDFTGGWFDLARIDAIATACGVAALVVSRSQRHPAVSVPLAAALATLGCLGKQSLLALALSLAASFFVVSWRRAASYLAALALMLVATVASLQASTDGWFRFWVYDILTGAPTYEPLVLGYWIECALALGPAIAIAVYAMIRFGWRADVGLWGAAAALFVAGWAGRSHEGGFENNLIPPLLAVALFFGPAAGRLASSGGWRGGIVAAAAFIPLGYHPGQYLPSEADRLAGDEVVERLRSLEPPLWMPDHGYLAVMAHGDESPPGIHGQMINDLLKSGHDDLALQFVRQLEEALGERRFGAVILDEIEPDLPVLLEGYHRPMALWDEGDERFIPVNGSPKRPAWVYLRRTR